MRSIALLFGFLFFSTSSQAAITIESIAGANWRIDPITAQIVTIAGFNGTCATPGTGLCNTCVNTAFETCTGDAECCGGNDGQGNQLKCQTCNTQAVTDSTLLTITFRSDTTLTGLPQLSSQTGERIAPSTSGVGIGGRFIYTSPWSEVCQVITGCSCSAIRAGTCSEFQGSSLPRVVSLGFQGGGDTASLNFRLYFQRQLVAASGAQNSLTSYSIYPGDAKVYLENPNVEGYTPGTASENLTQVRVYIGTGNFNNAYVVDAGNGTGFAIEPATLSVDTNGVDQIVDGLENDVTYHFRTASVDEAGNVYAFMDNAYIKNYQINGVNVCPDTALPEGGNSLCPFYGTPSRVMGLLSEDMNCFIATAAYGSSLDPHIETFRKFRFQVLLRSELGQKLNLAYYNYGAKFSHFIHDRKWAKTLSRGILWPTWGLVSLSLYLKLNLWQTFGLFLISFALVTTGGVFLIRLLTNRRTLV